MNIPFQVIDCFYAAVEIFLSYSCIFNLIYNMFIVGLTGGIATGKSTVSEIFKQHGVPVIDADVIARKGDCKFFMSRSVAKHNW